MIGRARSEWRVLLMLTGIWVSLVLLVDPRGNFPMLDDWSYGRSVKHLLEHGVLRYDGWNAPTLFLQVLYGAAFAWPSGFSFETLRLSTLVAGLAGGIGTFLLLREAAATRVVALTGSLALMLSPSYFQHSFTFMTDVPFTALVVFSSLFFLRALRTGSVRSIAMGSVLACCATLVRQPGIMIPVAFGIATLATNPFSARLLARATVPGLAATATYLAYSAVIKHLEMEPVLLGTSQGILLAYFQGRDLLPGTLWLLNRARIVFADVSLMILPLLIVLGGYAASRRWRAGHLLAVLALALALVFALSIGLGASDLPYKVLSPMPLVMVGQADWGPSDEHHRLRPALVWTQLAAVSLMAFVLMSRAIRDSAKPAGRTLQFDRAGAIFGSCASALLMAPFLFSHLYERYLIPVIPVAMVALACLAKPQAAGVRRAWNRSTVVMAALTLLGFGMLSVAFAHDNLLWNRLRWQAVDVLVDQMKVDPAAIDGGLSVSGWYLFPAEGPLRRRYANAPAETRHWWRNDGAQYIVAITTPTRLERLIAAARRAPDDKLDVVWRKSFTGWLPGSQGDVVVCRGPLCGEVFKK